MKKLSLIFVMFWSLLPELTAAATYHNAFGAAKDADSFLVIKINSDKQIFSQYMLPYGDTTQLPGLDSRRLARLTAGNYIFPVKDGEVLTFAPPELKVHAPEHAYSFLRNFMNLSREAETGFLFDVLLRQRSSVRVALLKRIQENGLFNAKLDANHVAFLKDFYFREDLDIPEKRLLLENLAMCNFAQTTDIYIASLKDDKLAKLAGRIIHEHNRQLFESTLKKYVSNEKLWKYALEQSEFFTDDKEFVGMAMQWFDHGNPLDNSADFIPLICSAACYNNAYDKIIKEFLVNSKNTRAFETYRKLSYWLNYFMPGDFNEEIMQFLANNRENRYVTDSIIYPTMLSVLRKSGYKHVDRLLSEYIEVLKKRRNRRFAEQVFLLFKKENLPKPAIDSLEELLK